MTTTKFCTAADVKTLISTSVGWTGDDALIDAYIESATSLIRSYTRRIWEKAQYIDYFGTQDIEPMLGIGNGFVSYSLKEKPLSTLAAEAPVIKYDVDGTWSTAVPIDPLSYEVDYTRGRILLYPYRMVSYGRSLQISYYAGYPVDGVDSTLLVVDSALRWACARQAAFDVRRTLNAADGAASVGNRRRGKSFQSNAAGLVPDALALIKDRGRVLVGTHG